MLKLAEIFQNGMLLQRDKPVALWGTAAPGERVEAEIQGKRGDALAGADGAWKLLLPPLRAAEDETLELRGAAETLRLTGVAVGEVWLAGGQSNMEFHMRYEKHIAQVRPGCRNPRIRFYDVPELAFDGQRECFDYSRMGVWRSATPEDIDYFSAPGYYFARELERELDVPVGVIGCNWGGTVSAAWMDPKTVRLAGPEWMEAYEDFLAATDWEDYMRRQRSSPMNDRGNPFADPFGEVMMAKTPSREDAEAFFASMAASGKLPEIREGEIPVHHIPGALYKRMVKETAPFTLRGVLWYQGESDDEMGRAALYSAMLTGLIGDWRRLWADRALPFLIVQLPGFGGWLDVKNRRYDLIRAAQETVTKTVENCHLCSISDAGEEADIHPKDKLVVGRRLALLALGHVYGRDILCDAPSVRSAEFDGTTLAISFDHAGDGLALRGERVHALTVRAEGRTPDFTAEVRGDRLLLRLAERVSGPVTVEHAKEKFYLVNLYNSAGIPAIPFSLTLEPNA